MEAVRNAAPGLKGRAIAGPHNYEQIPALVERSKQRVANFYSDFNFRLADVPFVAGDDFSIADITAVVTVDFATKASGLPIPDQHAALRRGTAPFRHALACRHKSRSCLLLALS